MADGSNIEINLGTSDGTERNSYIGFANMADADGGLILYTSEPDGTTGNLFLPTTQRENLARGVWHRLDIVATFGDGATDDSFTLLLNGTRIDNIDTGGTTFATLEGYFTGNGEAYRQTNRLMFRSGVRPSDLGAFSDTAAQGFAFDQVRYWSSNSSAPDNPLAYYYAGFETDPTLVYVNQSFGGLPGDPIVDADSFTAGDQSATFGTDAFADLDPAASGVAAGGQVWVFNGNYSGGTIGAGTSLVPGGTNGTAQVRVGPLALATGSTLAMDVNGSTPGTGYDQITGTGTINIGGAQLAVTTRGAAVPSAVYTLVEAAGGLIGQFANLPEGATVSINGYQYKIRYSPTAVTLELDRADVSVTITDNRGTVPFGGVITYTVVVTNNGPRTAAGTQLNVQLPAGLVGATYSSTVTGGATGNTASGGGAPSDLLTLPSGATVTYTITAQVATNGTLSAVANVIPPFVSVYDANLGNNIASDGTAVIPPDTVRPATQIIVAGSPTAGQPIGLAVVFSEPVTGFTAAAIGLTNATIAGFTPQPGGAIYSLFIVPTSAGEVRVTVPEASAADGANNPNLAASITFTAAPAPLPQAPQPIRYAIAVGGLVTVYNPVDGSSRQITPFPGFGGTVTVATGDLNNDGIPDVVVGAGPGGGPHVKAFDGSNGAEIASFYAYNPAFSGGVFVAAGGGRIVTGAGAGGGPHVKMFNSTGAELGGFFAYGETFTGGVRVAVGDVGGDGSLDIVTGAGAGASPHVKVFSFGSLAETHSFFAFGESFSGGVYVAVGGGRIVVGAGEGGGPHVKLFDAVGTELNGTFAYGESFTGGVRVAVADTNNDGTLDLLTGAGPGAAPHVKVFALPSLTEINSLFAASAENPAFGSGVYVA